MSVAFSAFGFAVLVNGLDVGAQLLDGPAKWVLLGCAVRMGLGLLESVAVELRRHP